mmetsp:Transcript_46841/g.146760  ORF Transcript_46841/g.146760 Transcript_46841/m.146760 type:complete len:475 (-) Transcript_46841:251-1675(-)
MIAASVRPSGSRPGTAGVELTAPMASRRSRMCSAYAHMDTVEEEPGGPPDVCDKACPSCSQRCAKWREAARLALDEPESGPVAAVVHYAMIVLIVLSTLTAVLQTDKEFAHRYAGELVLLEVSFTACFTAEILARIWVTEDRCTYFAHFSNLVDILATSPWYVEQGLHVFLVGEASSHGTVDSISGSLRTLRMVRLIRMVRLLRVLRLAKAARHSETLTTVFESIGESVEGIFVLVFFVGMSSMLCATLVYAVESEVEGGKFASIPASMWWSMATITTVGYGDVVPSTSLGKSIACITMVVGTIVVSISVAAITTSFTDSYNRKMSHAKLVKSLRKASRHFGDDEQASNPAPTDEASPEQSAMDLLRTFTSLEEDVNMAMTRLEQAIDAVSVPIHQVGEESPHGRAPSASQVALGGREPGICVRPALQALREQSALLFRTASSLAEEAAEAEAERRSRHGTPGDGHPPGGEGAA